MRAVVQKVITAAVSVDGVEINRIDEGFLVLLAVKVGDQPEQAKKMADKLAKLRIIEDDNGKLNLSLLDKQQPLLLVSQFTLYGDCSQGNRPSFVQLARPELALPLFELVAESLRAQGVQTLLGSFGAYMQISLVNDGPTTVIVEV